MTDKKDEALLRALGVLVEVTNYTGSEAWSPSMTRDCERVIKYIKDALAEQTAQQQEPVAWMGVPVMPGRYKEAVFCSDKDLAMQWDYGGHLGLGRLIVTPLYTSPQPRREWAGLTDEDKLAIRRLPWETPADLIDNTEAKLRDKNAQPSKPLTDEQWQVIADTLGCLITRSQKDTIEAALGIKGETE